MFGTSIRSFSLMCGLLLAGSLAHADCTYPKQPTEVPNPQAATQEEMISAMQAFKQYNTDVDSYIGCLDKETEDKTKEAVSASAILQIKALQAKKKSSVTDERQATIDSFNKAVREFKAAHKS